jgi:cytochrome c
MLKLFCTWVVALTALTGIANAQDANEKAKKGAAAYQLCAACHSLQPGVHLSGPSLAGCGCAGFAHHRHEARPAGISLPPGEFQW